MLGGVAGVAGVVAIGGIGLAVAPDRLRSTLGLEPDPFIPDAPEGRVAVERVHSEARGTDVDLFTAVPAGHGDGVGLPVVVILHGAKASASDFRAFGFGRFLTRSVRDGAAPFVLAGADGGRLRWEKDPSSADDPAAMVLEELPVWLQRAGLRRRSAGAVGMVDGRLRRAPAGRAGAIVGAGCRRVQPGDLAG